MRVHGLIPPEADRVTSRKRWSVEVYFTRGLTLPPPWLWRAPWRCGPCRLDRPRRPKCLRPRERGLRLGKAADCDARTTLVAAAAPSSTKVQTWETSAAQRSPWNDASYPRPRAAAGCGWLCYRRRRRSRCRHHRTRCRRCCRHCRRGQHWMKHSEGSGGHRQAPCFAPNVLCALREETYAYTRLAEEERGAS